MSLMEDLKRLDVDVDEGLGRVMEDASLYEMMLGMFVDVIRDNPFSLEDFDGGDTETLIKRIHTLKGITGNLAITPLFEGYTEALALLRAGQPADAKREVARILPAQKEIVACIKRYRAQ